jgi:hypothetical protein
VSVNKLACTQYVVKIKELKFFINLFSLLSLLSAPTLVNAFPTIGVAITNAAVETIAVSTPLPNLDGSGLIVTPQYGIIKTELINRRGVTDIYTPKPDYSGEVSGNSVGLGITLPSHSDLSFFIYGGGLKQTGEFQIQYDSAVTFKYTDFKATGAFAFAAAQYRAIGDEKSFFALGVFGGPAYYTFESDLVFNQLGVAQPASPIKFNPSGYGAILGVQTLFRLGGFRINPYIITLMSAGDRCQVVEVPDGGQVTKDGFNCGGKIGYADVPSGFGGIGLSVGYKYFRFKVLSYFPAQAEQPLKVTSYALSYGFEF